MKNILSLILLVGLVLVSLYQAGCSALATKSRNEEELAKIKKVAVVAFTANLPKSANVSLDLSSGKAQSERGGSLIAGQSRQMDKILQEFNENIEKEKHWKVLDISSMRSQPAYQEAFKATMEGWQNKMPASAGTQDFLVPGIMDKDALRILRFEGREKLLSQLGVDAIILSHVSTHLAGTSVMGIGSRKPQAKVHIEVFGRGLENPIWFETFEGEVSKESVGMTGFIDEDKVAELTLVSARLAFKKMGSATK